jgi:dolichyl-diphosphooligosaccharide--protein glycosyltransferase
MASHGTATQGQSTSGSYTERRWLWPALFLLALAIRALPWRSLFDGDRVHLFGNDAYYHLRRIEYSLQRFPSSLDFDPYVNFPRGGEPIWPGFFDLLLALLLRPFAGNDGAALARVAVWIPPLLGALCVVALYALARRLFDASVATLAALLLAILSAHFWYSQIGFVDHHAGVALTTTLLLACALGLLRRAEPPSSSSLLGSAVVTRLVAALCLLVWPGSLLHVAIVELGLLVMLLALPTREGAVRFAVALAVSAALAALVLAPPGLGRDWRLWGSFSPVVLSSFQPWIFAAASCFAVACAVLWRRTAAGAHARSRRVSAAVVVLALGGAGVLAFPDLLRAVGDASSWFAKTEGFQASVGESAPLLLEGDTISFESAELRLSRLFYLFPLALGAALWRACHAPAAAPLRLFLLWSTVLCAATLVQLRFMNSFSVALALLMAWGCVELYRVLPEGWKGGPLRRLALTGVFAGALVLLCQPMFPTYHRHLRNQLNAVRGGPVLLTRTDLFTRSLAGVGAWLRANTPPTSGWLDPAETPEYGVLSAWTAGHVLRYTARRPMVRDNFGDDAGSEGFREGLEYFLAREPKATEILDRLRVRYVVVHPYLSQEGPRPGRDSMFVRLHLHDGSGSGQHRLIYESEPMTLERYPKRISLKVFEYVSGARLTGRAPPGTWVEVRLSLRTNRDRDLQYRNAVDADADGRYALRLPYATSGGPPAVRTNLYYAVVCWRDRKEVSIDEASVRSGADVAGPDLCL